MVHLDEFMGFMGTHWIALFVNGDNLTHFDSFGVAYIPKTIEKLIGNKNIIINIHRIQANDSTVCGYFSTFVHQRTLSLR